MEVQHMEHTEKTYHDQNQLWKERLDDLKASGLTQKAWCQENQIPQSTLRYWIRKLKSEASAVPSSWLQLDPARQTMTIPDSEIIVQRAGIRIILSPASDPALGRRLVQLLLK